MVASTLAATVVTAILRCDFGAAKLKSQENLKINYLPNFLDICLTFSLGDFLETFGGFGVVGSVEFPSRSLREEKVRLFSAVNKGAGRTRGCQILPQNPCPKKGQNGALSLP